MEKISVYENAMAIKNDTYGAGKRVFDIVNVLYRRYIEPVVNAGDKLYTEIDINGCIFC